AESDPSPALPCATRKGGGGSCAHQTVAVAVAVAAVAVAVALPPPFAEGKGRAGEGCFCFCFRLRFDFRSSIQPKKRNPSPRRTQMLVKNRAADDDQDHAAHDLRALAGQGSQH